MISLKNKFWQKLIRDVQIKESCYTHRAICFETVGSHFESGLDHRKRQTIFVVGIQMHADSLLHTQFYYHHPTLNANINKMFFFLMFSWLRFL